MEAEKIDEIHLSSFSFDVIKILVTDLSYYYRGWLSLAAHVILII